MVINYISDFCFPGGIPVHQGETASILSEKYGCEVRICVPWPLRYDMEEHKSFIRNAMKNGSLEKLYPPLKYLTCVREDEIGKIVRSADINHFHGSFSTNRSFLGEAIDALPDKRNTYYTFHSEKVNPECSSDNAELLRRLDRIDTVFAVSSSVRESVRQTIGNREVIITPNGYSLAEKPCAEKKRQFTVLFVGRLNKTKGIENVIRLGELIKNTDIRLIIAGAAEFDQKYDKQVSKLAECSNIIWLDKSLPKSRILELYTESDVFYFPSHMEGSPLVVLDAVANGCIPVVSYAGSLNEIVENGVNGFISHFDDFDSQYSAIMELSRNRELFRRIKENVLKTRLPSWEDTADMLMKIYSEGQKK